MGQVDGTSFAVQKGRAMEESAESVVPEWPRKVTRGRFGIPRYSNGELADNAHEWPWYWRYSAALLLLVATAASAIYVDSIRPGTWLVWLIVAAGGMWSLYIGYEIGYLLAFTAFIWGAVKLLGFVIPDSWSLSPRVQQWILAAVAVFAYIGLSSRIDNLERQVRDLQRENEGLRHGFDSLWHRAGAGRNDWP